MTPDPQTEAILRAHDAAKAGRAHSENPYTFPDQSKLHLTWSHTWLKTRVEMETGTILEEVTQEKFPRGCG